MENHTKRQTVPLGQIERLRRSGSAFIAEAAYPSYKILESTLLKILIQFEIGDQLVTHAFNEFEAAGIALGKRNTLFTEQFG